MALLNVDIDLLRTFLTVLDTQSFTRTAERLLRTQPAISQQIKKLEDTVGAPLITRDRNAITPTTTGLVVKSYAEGIIGLNDKMLADLLDAAPAVLRIGLPDDYAAIYLPEILRIAALRLPETEISCHADISRNLGKRVANGDLDLAILTADPETPIDDSGVTIVGDDVPDGDPAVAEFSPTGTDGLFPELLGLHESLRRDRDRQPAGEAGKLTDSPGGDVGAAQCERGLVGGE